MSFIWFEKQFKENGINIKCNPVIIAYIAVATRSFTEIWYVIMVATVHMHF